MAKKGVSRKGKTTKSGKLTYGKVSGKKKPMGKAKAGRGWGA